jgi:MFS family permease
MILPTPAVSFLFGMTAAFWVRRTSLRKVLVTGSVLTGVPFVLWAFAHHSRHLVYVWTAIQGSGAGLSYATLAAAVLLAVPLHQSGVASGMNANIRTIGGAFGTAVVAALLAANKAPSGLPTEHGYTLMFVVIGAAFFVAAGMCLLVPATPVAGAPHDPEVVGPAVHEAEITSDSPPRPGGEAVP